MAMGNSKNSCVFNFAILLKPQKFDAREIYMFYCVDLSWWKPLCSTVVAAYCSIPTRSLNLQKIVGTDNVK